MKWKRDSLNDYNITINLYDENKLDTTGKIIRCPIVHRYNHRFWQTQCRWLLLVNNQFYGFWKSLGEAKTRFENDCIKKILN